MKRIASFISLCAAMAAPAVMSAVEPVTFETENYKSLGGYDTWQASPFRTGELKANVAVVGNPALDEANPTEKVLGVQRSRFGSNTFGARIDLKEPLVIAQGEKYYCHVLINKPVDGRVMLIGLGKRSDREGQSPEVEQFWAYPVSDMKTGEWFDAVFPIKCNPGVEIRSLVVVPDCEQPLRLTDDFVAYVDEIVIDNSLKPRIGLADYPVNFSTEAGWSRDDRKILGVSFNGGADGNQSITIPNAELKGYNERFEKPFLVKAGATVTPAVNYQGTWMHSYLYLDRGKDGAYSYGVGADKKLDPSTDLMSYSYYQGYNSKGTAITNNNVLTLPSFTVPADLAPGIYRMRYKVDWNDIDPGGSIADGNYILNNGGGVVDVLLNVHGDVCNVTQDNRNGEVLLADGEVINNYQAPFGKPLTIKMNPSNGFTYNGIRLRHGYNLTADSLVKSTPQYRDEFFYINDFNADDTFTIPGEYMDGDVLIEGLFVEEGKGMERKKVTYNIELDGKVIDTQTFNVLVGDDYPEPVIETEASPAYYSITGFPEGKTEGGDEVITLTLTQKLPFLVSDGQDNAEWYNIAITHPKTYLTHSPSATYISLSTQAQTQPTASDHNSQWAFTGDVLHGFTIINRGAGEGFVLSSSTNTSANTGGYTYPVMTATPVPEGNNERWFPTVSNSINGETNAFYLHQAGFPDNRMNSRDSRLAYWTGGADAGSTFRITHVDSTSGIDGILTDGTADNGSVKFYNLQGVRVSADNLTPGIYIRRQNGRATKILVR